MKKSKLLLKKVAICSKLQRHHVSDLSNKTDISAASSAEETLTLSVLFTLRLAAVFTAESQFHHQVLRKINVGAIKPLPACKMQLTPHVVGCAATQWSVIQSAHTHTSADNSLDSQKSFIPVLLLGSSCTDCNLDCVFQRLTAAHLSPALLCSSICGNLPM